MVRAAIWDSPSALGCTITGLVVPTTGSTQRVPIGFQAAGPLETPGRAADAHARRDPAGADRLPGVVAVGDAGQVDVRRPGGCGRTAYRVVERRLQVTQV